jgi:hypothetical protein
MAIITMTTDPPVDTHTPTPTRYELISAEIQEAVDKIVFLLPKLEESLDAELQQVRRNLNVPDVYCYTAVNVLVQFPELNAGKKIDVDRCLNELQFIAAFRPMRDRVAAALRRVDHALRAKKSSVATATLQVLRIAKAYASDNKNPGIAAAIAAMQRDLGRKTSLTRAQQAERRLVKLGKAAEPSPAGKEVQAPTA